MLLNRCQILSSLVVRVQPKCWKHNAFAALLKRESHSFCFFLEKKKKEHLGMFDESEGRNWPDAVEKQSCRCGGRLTTWGCVFVLSYAEDHFSVQWRNYFLFTQKYVTPNGRIPLVRSASTLSLVMNDLITLVALGYDEDFIRMSKIKHFSPASCTFFFGTPLCWIQALVAFSNRHNRSGVSWTERIPRSRRIRWPCSPM